MRRSVMRHMFLLNSLGMNSVVARGDSVITLRDKVATTRIGTILIGRLCRFCPIARSNSLSGIGKMMGLGSLILRLSRRGFGLPTLARRTAFFRRGVGICGTLRRVGTRGVDHTLIYSRFKTYIKVVALHSVLRNLINSVSSTKRRPSVVGQVGGSN